MSEQEGRSAERKPHTFRVQPCIARSPAAFLEVEVPSSCTPYRAPGSFPVVVVGLVGLAKSGPASVAAIGGSESSIAKAT